MPTRGPRFKRFGKRNEAEGPPTMALGGQPPTSAGESLAIAALTPRQRLFAEEYLVDLNGTQAAIRAGYSQKTADRQVARLLRIPGVVALHARHAAEVGRRLQLTIERVERELAAVCLFDPATMFGPDGKLLPIAEMPEEARRAISGFDEEALFEMVPVGTGPRGGIVKERKQVGVLRKLRFGNKIEACRLALQRLGALVERHELVAPMKVTVNIGTRKASVG